jgi:hypothetical protein
MKCCVNNCESENRVPKKGGYCGKHQHHIRRYGYIEEITVRSPNNFIFYNDYFGMVIKR